jgi:hypothetical protein
MTLSMSASLCVTNRKCGTPISYAAPLYKFTRYMGKYAEKTLSYSMQLVDVFPLDMNVGVTTIAL